MELQTLTYQIQDRLYINITNRCSNNCIFCIRKTKGGVGYNLWLEREPTAEEIIKSAGDVSSYSEIVFCGYGEPLMRFETIKEVAKALKEKGAFLRVNTNGQASLLYKRNIPRELNGLMDVVSISLNAHAPENYMELCQPALGEKAYPAVLEFVRECKLYIPQVVLSVVKWPGVDVAKCSEIARSMGVDFRVRTYSG